MKYLLFIFALPFLVSCKSQINTTRKVASSESIPSFKNRAEEEEFWIKRFFENEYEKSEYPKFSDTIKINNSEIQFGDIQYIKYENLKPEYKWIFEVGLLYPNIVSEKIFILHATGEKSTAFRKLDTMNICCLEELTFLSDNPKIKRFRFWSSNGSMNPSVYFFELINETANKETNWESFIENAKLTFVKYGWTIL